MSLLSDTLRYIVDSLNNATSWRVVRGTVSSPGGSLLLDLEPLLPKGAVVSTVSTVNTGRRDVVATWTRNGSMLAIVLESHGVHFRPQPWDGLAEPVEVVITAGFTLPAFDFDGLKGGDVQSASYELPAGLQHVVPHGFGTERFIERITSMDGVAQYASVEALGPDEIQITLAEAIPVRLDVIFLPSQQV